MLLVRPASCITGSSRKTEESPSAKAGRSHLPPPVSTQARRKILGIRQATVSGCCRSTSSVNGSPGRTQPHDEPENEEFDEDGEEIESHEC